MIKILRLLFITVLIVGMSSISAFAIGDVNFNDEVSLTSEFDKVYDYGTQTFTENDKDYADIIDILDAIQDQAKALDIHASIFSGNDTVIVSKAVKVYMFDPQKFIELLNSPDISKKTFMNWGSEVWRIPVGINTQGNYVYSNVYTLDNGEYDTVTIENKPGVSNVEYVFDENIVNQILSNSNIMATELLPISVRQIHSDFIFVPDSYGNNYFISFSARPDFLGLKNGEIYTQEEVRAAISELSNRINAGIASRGDVNGSNSDNPYAIMALIFLLMFVAFIIISFIHKKYKRSVKV